MLQLQVTKLQCELIYRYGYLYSYRSWCERAITDTYFNILYFYILYKKQRLNQLHKVLKRCNIMEYEIQIHTWFGGDVPGL